MSHTANGVTANYIWDINRSVPQVLQDGTNKYVYGLGRISATDGSGNQTFFTADGLGSTANLTSSAAAVTDTYSYDVFGAVRSHSGSSPNQRLFTGEQMDAGTGDTGLQYLRARYYDQATGRFLSKDPLGIGNRYSYVGNNPVNFIDPYGLFDCGPFSDACDTVEDAVDTGVDVANAVIDSTIGVAANALEGAVQAGFNAGSYLASAIGNEAVLELTASSMQIVSNAMMWASCPAIGAPGVGGVAAGICTSAVVWYAAATLLKYNLADSPCERNLVMASAVAGLVPHIRYIANLLTGLNSAVDAIGCADPAYANASDGSPGSKE